LNEPDPNTFTAPPLHGIPTISPTTSLTAIGHSPTSASSTMRYTEKNEEAAGTYTRIRTEYGLRWLRACDLNLLGTRSGEGP
jgi:hypothetical protein